MPRGGPGASRPSLLPLTDLSLRTRPLRQCWMYEIPHPARMFRTSSPIGSPRSKGATSFDAAVPNGGREATIETVNWAKVESRHCHRCEVRAIYRAYYSNGVQVIGGLWFRAEERNYRAFHLPRGDTDNSSDRRCRRRRMHT